MGLEFNYAAGQTSLDEDEKEGLKIAGISTRQELDEFEQQNIEKAVEWTIRRRFKAEVILSEKFIRELHKRMFDDIWDWAGEFRKTNKNIGVEKHQIAIELKMLLDDCYYWLEHTTYPDDEIAIRFKHRIVSIHCFSNGNGRHARLIADVISQHIFNRPVFTWSRGNAMSTRNPRDTYLEALREADRGHIQALLDFARS